MRCEAEASRRPGSDANLPSGDNPVVDDDPDPVLLRRSWLASAPLPAEPTETEGDSNGFGLWGCSAESIRWCPKAGIDAGDPSNGFGRCGSWAESVRRCRVVPMVDGIEMLSGSLGVGEPNGSLGRSTSSTEKARR